MSGGVEALRQWSAGENVNWSKIGIAAAAGAAGTAAGMLTGGAGAAPFAAGAVGGGLSAFSNRLGQDLYDGKGVRVEYLVQDTVIGAFLGGVLSAGAHRLLPKARPQWTDLSREQKLMAMAVTVPENARTAMSVGLGDVAALAAHGAVDALRTRTELKPRNERCDRLSASCYDPGAR